MEEEYGLGPSRISRLVGRLSLIILSLATILSLAGSIYGLRQNNLRMIELRDEVFAADRDNGDVEQALRDLRDFVGSHMNTDIKPNVDLSIEGEAPIQRVYGYYRDTLAEYIRVASNAGPEYVAIIEKARLVCEKPEIPVATRLDCVYEYIDNNSDSDFPVVQPLSKEYYIHDFYSPYWSLDLPGVSLIVFGVCIVMFAFRFIIGWAYRE